MTTRPSTAAAGEQGAPNTLSTHALDTALGIPARGMAVSLQRLAEGKKHMPVASGTTNHDGRVPGLMPEGAGLQPGIYRMTFQTGDYYAATGQQGFYPIVHVDFEVRGQGQHYHIPLLVSPYGYSTYRGS